MKPDYVICVGGTPGFGWLTLPSDEQDADAVIVTTQIEQVACYSSVAEAMPVFNRLRAAHPKRSFRIMSITPFEGPQRHE